MGKKRLKTLQWILAGAMIYSMNSLLAQGLEKNESKRAIWLRNYIKECDEVADMARYKIYLQQRKKEWLEKRELSGRVYSAILEGMEKNQDKEFRRLDDRILQYPDRS
ncbi:MAG: hypothetical protein V1886_02255 [archaeon]